MQISAIVSKASAALSDEDTTRRWPETDLIGYLNSFLYTLTTVRPVAFEATAPLTLVAGAKQTIPATAARLIDITYNLAVDGVTPGQAVLPMSKSALDLHSPNWRSDTQSGAIENFAYDPKQSLETFYVYPPAVVGTKVEASVVTRLVPLTATTDLLPVDDEYEPMAIDYILGRAYAKNSDLAEMNKAQAYFQSCFTGLGLHEAAAKYMATKSLEGA